MLWRNHIKHLLYSNHIISVFPYGASGSASVATFSPLLKLRLPHCQRRRISFSLNEVSARDDSQPVGRHDVTAIRSRSTLMKASSAFVPVFSRPPTLPSSAAPTHQHRHQRFKSHDLDSHDPNFSLGASLRWSRKFPQGRHEAPTTSLSLADLRAKEKNPGDNEASDPVLQGNGRNKRKRKRWGVFKWILTLSVFSVNNSIRSESDASSR